MQSCITDTRRAQRPDEFSGSDTHSSVPYLSCSYNSPVANYWTLRRVRRVCTRSRDDEGFSLIELMIVMGIVPIIIGSLVFGLVVVFSNSSTAGNRLSDSSDAQQVTAFYQPDVQSAQGVETDSPSPACGSGQQLLGLEWSQPSSSYEDYVSYDEVQIGSTGTLVRQFCTNGSTTPTSTLTLSHNYGESQVCIYLSANPTVCDQPATWIPTSGVSNVAFQIDEPEKGTGSPGCVDTSNTFCYTLDAAPESVSTSSSGSGPVNVSSATGCDYAESGSGPLASSLCLLDFSDFITNPNLLTDAETPGSCLEQSVQLSGSFELYFCINITNSISGEIISPYSLPTWCQGFLGNPGYSAACKGNTGVYPNYYNVAGDPALYQQGTGAGKNNGGITDITLTDIDLVNASGIPATGWDFVSADAESTDNGNGGGAAEWLTWNANTDLYVVNNGYTAANGFCGTGSSDPCDTTTDPFGTACDSGGSWTVGSTKYYGIGAGGAGPLITTSSLATSEDTTPYFSASGVAATTNTVECTVPPTGVNDAVLTGEAMVEAVTPSSFSVQLGDNTGGLEGVVLGLLTS
jgi:prepilin-type N-terminal cleavage/methylation domain-containing protein